jgi:hypothetical protein
MSGHFPGVGFKVSDFGFKVSGFGFLTHLEKMCLAATILVDLVSKVRGGAIFRVGFRVSGSIWEIFGFQFRFFPHSGLRVSAC